MMSLGYLITIFELPFYSTSSINGICGTTMRQDSLQLFRERINLDITLRQISLNLTGRCSLAGFSELLEVRILNAVGIR